MDASCVSVLALLTGHGAASGQKFNSRRGSEREAIAAALKLACLCFDLFRKLSFVFSVIVSLFFATCI